MTSNLEKHPDSKQLFTLDCKFNDKVSERSTNKKSESEGEGGGGDKERTI